MKIQILATSGEGKTTIGLFIQKVLQDNGFSNVTFFDPDITNSELQLVNFDKKVSSIKNRQILIETHQTIRAKEEIK